MRRHLWGRGRRLELCHIRLHDFRLPFMMQLSENFFANSVFIELWFYRMDDIVYDSSVNGRHNLIRHCG